MKLSLSREIIQLAREFPGDWIPAKYERKIEAAADHADELAKELAAQEHIINEACMFLALSTDDDKPAEYYKRILTDKAREEAERETNR